MAEQIKVNAKELAEAWGISFQAVYNHVKKGNIPEPVKSQWEWPKINIIFIEHLKELAQGFNSLSLTDERIRLTKINADRKQLQLDKERGDIVNVETAMRLWGNVCQKIRQRLLAVPTKLPPVVYGIKELSKIKSKTDDFIREVLNELADIDLGRKDRGIPKGKSRRKGIRGIKGSSKHSKAAAGSDNIRMGRRKKSAQSRVLR